MSSLVIDLLAEVWLWLVQTEPDRRSASAQVSSSACCELTRGLSKQPAEQTRAGFQLACTVTFPGLRFCIEQTHCKHCKSLHGRQVGDGRNKESKHTPHRKYDVNTQWAPKGWKAMYRFKTEKYSPIFGGDKLACLNAKSMR